MSGKVYDGAPQKVCTWDVGNSEFMLWLYLPVKLPFGEVSLPDNVNKFKGILDIVKENLSHTENKWEESYIYLTIKSMVVSEDNVGQRLGWHSDGFMTKDLNYIWSDVEEITTRITTGGMTLTQCHTKSLQEMENYKEFLLRCSYQVMADTVYLLDETVLHEAVRPTRPVFRNFVKVTVSDKLYKLEGNSVNHLLGDYLPENLIKRNETRNCPQGIAEKYYV